MIYNESKYNSHWDTKKLNELGTFDRGKSRHRPRDDKRLFECGKYPLIQTGDVKAANLYITSHSAEYGEFGLAQSKMWSTGTLCITIAANIAETALLGYPMCFPDSIIGFNAFPEETSELFMHYVFTYIKKAIQNSTGGSIQDNINKEYLEDLDLKIPKKPYQDKIVSLLSSIDKKIELNDKINKEIENLAKTIYNYWFVQFEFPNDEGKPYKTSGGKMMWSEELKREIPACWEVKYINELVDVCSGYSFSSNDYVDEESYKLLTIKNVQDGYINYEVDSYIDELPENMPDYCILKKGDILMSLTGNVGRVGFVTQENCLLNQRVATIIPKFENTNYFFYHMFRSEELQSIMQRIATGTSQKNLSPIDVGNLLVTFNRQVVDKFCEITNSIYDRKLKIEIENYQLIKMRDWLLPMLMTGQVKFI